MVLVTLERITDKLYGDIIEDLDFYGNKNKTEQSLFKSVDIKKSDGDEHYREIIITSELLFFYNRKPAYSPARVVIRVDKGQNNAESALELYVEKDNFYFQWRRNLPVPNNDLLEEFLNANVYIIKQYGKPGNTPGDMIEWIMGNNIIMRFYPESDGSDNGKRNEGLFKSREIKLNGRYKLSELGIENIKEVRKYIHFRYNGNPPDSIERYISEGISLGKDIIYALLTNPRLKPIAEKLHVSIESYTNEELQEIFGKYKPETEYSILEIAAFTGDDPDIVYIYFANNPEMKKLLRNRVRGEKGRIKAYDLVRSINYKENKPHNKGRNNKERLLKMREMLNKLGYGGRFDIPL